ncbi:MAG: tetratricopeptide repeat protein [Gammaproteobacteria bacterium]|nr:tetratricopeptide repeat protein [Gammaproteobacteria bacterium]
MPLQSFFAELRKRKVVQFAAIYGAVAWGVTEIVVTVVEQLFLPQWVSTLAVIGFVVGFPVAMFLSWTFDITSKGIQRTDVSSRRGKASIVMSMVLLVAGTAGLFLLIKPSIDGAQPKADVLPNSVAIMPFDNATGNSDNNYLSEGLSDELRSQLGRVPGLLNAARSSCKAISELGGDAVLSSAKLGVAYLVEGSMRRHGNLLRVSVQLVDGTTGLAIWSETFDRGPAEFLNVQQTIAEEIVRRVLPEAKDVVTAPATRNSTANEAIYRGRYYEQQVRDRQVRDDQTLQLAINQYRDAVDLDPESALAHSRLAGALLFLGDLDAAEAPINRAMVLNPNLSEVQHTMGLYYFARGLPNAYAAFERAFELDPDNADALESYAFTRWIGGNDVDVANLYRRALAIDRHTLSRYGGLGQILGKQAKTGEVVALIRRIEQRFDGADANRLISRLLELIGKVDEAIAWGIRARDLEPDNLDHVGWLAELYASIGDFETARSLDSSPSVGLLYTMRRYGELIDVAEFLMIDDPGDVEVRFLLAFAYNTTSQYEAAVRVLSSTGLPETLMTFPRMGVEWEGYFTLMNATFGLGAVDVSEGLASWFANATTRHDNPDWFDETYGACCLAVLGRDTEALDELEEILQSPRLVPIPVLEDSPCFQKFASNPRYQAVVEHFASRRAELRGRLPATLEKFGVSL